MPVRLHHSSVQLQIHSPIDLWSALHKFRQLTFLILTRCRSRAATKATPRANAVQRVLAVPSQALLDRYKP